MEYDLIGDDYDHNKGFRQAALACLDIKGLSEIVHDKRKEISKMSYATKFGPLEAVVRYCDGFMTLDEFETFIDEHIRLQDCSQVISLLESEIRMRSNEHVHASRLALEKQKRDIPIHFVASLYTNLPNNFRYDRTIKCFLPGHSDNTASLKLYPDNHFHCFGCHAHGSQVDMIQMMEQCSVKDAIQKFLKM